MNHDYSWMAAAARRWMAAEQKPRFTLITADKRSNAMQQPPIQPSHVPLHVHGDFNDIYSAINLLSLGADALTGIGNLMQPESKGGDEQLNLANRSDVSAVFRFFGEVLKEPTQVVYNSVECVQQAAEDQLP